MKKNRYLLFSIVMLFSCMISVHASCTDDEIFSLKKQVEDIMITYKHLGAVEDNSMIVYDRFDVTFKNIPVKMRIIDTDTSIEPVYILNVKYINVAIRNILEFINYNYGQEYIKETR